MKLRQTITTESSIHRKPMPHIKLQTSLEYEIVTQPDLVRHISNEYQGMVLLYDRILRHRKIIVNKKDTIWNWTFNTPCKSLKDILVLFEEEEPFVRDTRKFYNPKIQKVSVIVEGSLTSYMPKI